MSDDPAESPDPKAAAAAIEPDVERGLTGELPMAAAETVVELPQDPSAPLDPLLAELGRAASVEPLRAVEIAEAQAIVAPLAAHDPEATLDTQGPPAESPLYRLLEQDAVVASAAPPARAAAEPATGAPVTHAAAPTNGRAALPTFPLDPGRAVSTLNVRPIDPLAPSSERGRSDAAPPASPEPVASAPPRSHAEAAPRAPVDAATRVAAPPSAAPGLVPPASVAAASSSLPAASPLAAEAIAAAQPSSAPLSAAPLSAAAITAPRAEARAWSPPTTPFAATLSAPPAAASPAEAPASAWRAGPSAAEVRPASSPLAVSPTARATAYAALPVASSPVASSPVASSPVASSPVATSASAAPPPVAAPAAPEPALAPPAANLAAPSTVVATETPPPAPPPPPRGSVATPRVASQEPRRGGRPWGWLVAGGTLGLALGIAWASCGTHDGGGGLAERGRAVGVVEVMGPITDASTWVRDLRRFADGGQVEAIVVRVDSPGGSVAPSQEAFDAMRAASESVPVVVSIGSTAASGGFWIAMGGDWIVASAGSITGSIGVISQIPDLRGLADWAGVGLRTYRTGPYKDLGNPLRPVSPGEEAVFMELLSDVYEQFVTVVAERRHLSPDFVRTFADGRVFTGRRAFELGLVDQLGGLELAARRAIQLAEERQAKKADRKPKPIDEQPRLVYPPRAKPSVFDLLAEGAGASLVRGIRGEATRSIEAARTELGGPSVELR